jgi:hypothetical protein
MTEAMLNYLYALRRLGSQQAHLVLITNMGRAAGPIAEWVAHTCAHFY